MKHLVINGCSYGRSWTNATQLSERLAVDKMFNLSRPGSSNDRILRTTFEYVIRNPDVDFIIIMLTHSTRYEGPWRINRGTEEGDWISYSPTGISINCRDDEVNIDTEVVETKFIKNKYVYDHNHAYVEKTLINLFLLINWLDSLNINYCIFNTCDNIYKEPGFINVQSFKSKLDLISKNKKVIDLLTFISNQWMYDQGAIIPNSEIGIDPRIVHYGKDGYTLLNDFLYNYINEYCL